MLHGLFFLFCACVTMLPGLPGDGGLWPLRLSYGVDLRPTSSVTANAAIIWWLTVPQTQDMMEPMKPTQEVRAMTELEEAMERLRNRTEKDEREFQNYYATLETAMERKQAKGLWEIGTPLEELKYYVDF